MRKLNKKGFTLVELLAVIVILGVLMIVAIPAMSRYIENSRKDVYVNNAKRYISAARYSLLSDGYTCNKGTSSVNCGISDVNGTTKVVVPVSLISIENDTGKSPWGKTFDGTRAYVIVQQVSGKIVYKYKGCDSSNNGIIDEVEESSLSRANVVKGNSSCPSANAYTASATVLVATAEN